LNFLMPALLLTAISSCSKKSDTVVVAVSSSSIIVQSNWRVTYYSDSGTEGTANYNGFRFTFSANGSVAASNDLFTINGTWSTHNDDSSNKLLLNFGSSFPDLASLNHDWHIVEKTSAKLRMEDVSGGGSGTDYLTLEKN